MNARALTVSVLLVLSACGAEPAAPKPRVVAAAVPVEPVQPVESELPLAVEAPPIAALAPPSPAPTPLPPAIETHVWRLQHGESLAHFARWAELPVELVAETSGLPLDGQYPPGTIVRVPADAVDLALVEARRDAHWKRKLDGYLASRGGEQGVESYRVRTGDSAWTIARHAQGIPMWVLAAYNPDVRLERLVPGQALQVPVLQDTVVDAAPEATSAALAPLTLTDPQ